MGFPTRIFSNLPATHAVDGGEGVMSCASPEHASEKRLANVAQADRGVLIRGYDIGGPAGQHISFCWLASPAGLLTFLV